jgi:Carboxypeptidase regulatory-like domain
MRRSVVALALLGLCRAFLPSTSVSAQSTYGAIHGIVREGSGEPVAGATVIVTSVEKGTQFKQKTNKNGHYEFLQLLPESYDLTAEAAGKKTTTQDISVVADGEALVDPILPSNGQPSAITGTVGGSMLKTRTDLSTTFDRNAIQSLPNFDQNASTFPLLAPGAQIVGGNQNHSQNPEQSIQVSLNGSPFGGTASLLDGTDNRIPQNQTFAINPALESLAEIKITTQSYDAETGQALSGVVAVETRSGSNAWHGSLLDFRRTNWGEASNPHLQNPALATISPFRIDLFGGSLGGPIVKNKLFVFGDYQGTRSSFTSTRVLNVPTQLVRITCLNPTIAYCDLSEYGTTIYDPQMKASTPFTCAGGPAGYCIPRSSISQQAVNLLSLLPPPNLSGVDSNYSVAGSEAYNNDSFTVRVDDNLNEKFQLFGRFSFADYRVSSPSAFGVVAGGPGFGPDDFAGQSRNRDYSLSAGFDDSVSSSLTTNLRFGFYRTHLHLLQNDYNTTPVTNAGIFGLNLPGNSLTSGMPAILISQPPTKAVSSAIHFGDGQSVAGCSCPYNQQLQQFQLANNWANIQGKHLFKWGADFRYLRQMLLNSEPARTGSLGFSTRLTASSGSTPSLGLAAFLLGYVTSFNRTVGSISDAEVHQNRMFFYGQDTWRATPKLTLNYGLRWEIYFPQAVNGQNKGGYLDLNTGTVNVAGYPCCNTQGNIGTPLTNLAPRLGIAYQLNSRTIVRSAYGRNFDAASGEVFGTGAIDNPPVSLVQNAATTTVPDGATYVFQFQCANPAQCVPQPTTPLYPNVPSDGQILPKKLIAVALNSVPSKLKVPTLDQWNLSVQRELTSSMYFEVGYVGNKATHLPVSGIGYNLNQRTIAGYVENQCYNQTNDVKSPSCLDRYPLYPNFKWTQLIESFGDVASANYNSLQAKLVKRFSKGYEFHAHYIWAKGQGYDASYYNQNPGLDYAVNDIDRKHTFNFYNVLALPIGRGKALLGNAGTLANYLVGGWSINTVTTWASGLPFSPTYSSTECTFDRDTGPCRPNIVGGVRITGDRNNYFTTTGGQVFFRPPNSKTTTYLGPITIGPWQEPAVGTFGDAGRNSLRGPTYSDTDVAILKDIPITERYLLQFRTDFLNLFNRVNLGLPSGCVDCSTKTHQQIGAVITTLAPFASQRQVEFALRLQF